MPQETKSIAAEHENLEGWIPPLAGDNEIRAALEKAFDYRGDVTLTLRDGQSVEGYIFDRRSDGATLADCRVRLLPKAGGAKQSVSYADIAALNFSGRDTAAGKSFQTWVKNYREKKAAGQTNIRIDPEKLD
jgi:hypothetical protein